MKWLDRFIVACLGGIQYAYQILDRLMPQRRDIRAALLGVLTPIVILLGGRIWLFLESDKARPIDLWRIIPGEMQIWLSASLITAAALRLSPEKIRRWIRFALAAFAVFYALSTAIDTSLFAMTGSRIDLENLEVFAEEFWLIWPVVSSEMGALHWVLFFGIVLFTVWPVFVRFSERKSNLFFRFLFLALLPCAALSYKFTKRPVKELRPLEIDLISLFSKEISNRRLEYSIPPNPEDLIPLQVRKDASDLSPNVVLIVLESTGLHQTNLGSRRVRSTPTLSNLAKNGLYSKNMTTVLPHTTKALLSILCGDWPQLERRAKESRPGGLPGRCLPDLLGDLGYRTAFMQTAKESFEERKELVKSMGFDVFRSRETLDRDSFEESNYFGLDDLALVKPGLSWSTSEPDKPFFMTYLTLTSHHKYTLPTHAKPAKKIRSRRHKHLATVKYVDSVVKKIIDGYKENGLYDNTIFILVGDHGEGMGEHGRWQHDQVIWDEGLKVPFVIHAPKLLSKRGEIKGPRQQIDILPTVIEMVGAKIFDGSPRGTSLLASVPDDRVLYHSCLKQQRCLARREGDMKFIDHYDDRTWELFDLSVDPKERKNLVGSVEQSQLEAYRQELRDWKASVRGHYQAIFERWSDPDAQPVDEREALATWNGQLSMLSCDLQRERVIHFDTGWLHCDWRPNSSIGAWKTQVMLVDSTGQSFESSWIPKGGRFSAFRWKPNTVISDEVPFDIPEEAALGPAKVYVGWQNYSGSPRLLGNGEPHHYVADVLIDKPLKSGGDW